MKWDDLLICPFIPLVFLSPEKRVWGKMWWSSTPRWAHHGRSRLGKMLRCWCPQTQGWPLQGSVAALIGTGTWSRGRWWGQWNSYLPVLTSCPALCIFCCCLYVYIIKITGKCNRNINYWKSHHNIWNPRTRLSKICARIDQKKEIGTILMLSSSMLKCHFLM